MPTKIAHSVLLLLWAGFFLWLILWGQPALARLLHPKLWWLIICGAVVLLLFLGVNAWQPAAAFNAKTALRWRWPFLLILVVPIAYSTMLSSARFSGQTFHQRVLSDSSGALLPMDGGNSNEGISEPSTTSGEETPLTRITAQAEQMAGTEVETVCQILRDQQLPQDTMICYRFQVTCCAADARPVFILVRSGNHSPPGNDTWVRVRGLLSLQKNQGVTLPLLTAQTLTVVPEPAFPFLF